MKHYGRYVDDFYIVHGDNSVLLALIPKIRDFLRSRLGLELHPKKIYLQEVSNGVRFLGAVVYPYHIVPSGLVWRKVHGKYSLMERGFYALAAMRSVINSYLGLFRHFCAVKAVKPLIAGHAIPFRYGYYLQVRRSFVYKLCRSQNGDAPELA